MNKKGKSRPGGKRRRSGPKYETEIPEREEILEYLLRHGHPLTHKEICTHFRLGAKQSEAIAKRLNAMMRDGQVVRNRKNAWGVARAMDLIKGRVQAHPDGYGFLLPDTPGPDVYLSPRQMRRVLHLDRALVCVTGVDSRGRREGAIVEVLERAHSKIVGRFLEESGVAFVAPDDPRINQNVMIPPGKTSAAKPGQIVVADLENQPDDRHPPVGRVSKILGRSDAPGMAAEIAIHNFDLPDEWPAEALEEADGFGDSIPVGQLEGRKDLRDLPLVTIDGADARDFDDAVYCRRGRKGWRLVVAIADVAAYVLPGTALDEEARRRGTSVYFPGRVLPMLPESLSNGLCSLKPDVDRFCVACDLSVDEGGQVTRARFVRAVMRSRARLTYDDAQEMLDRPDSPLRNRDTGVTASVDELLALYQAFRRRRQKRGAIDFHSTDVRFRFGAEGEITAITAFHRKDSHRIIEECMITANVEAARFLARRRLPALYRVHEGPPAEKLENLELFLRGQGVKPTWRDQPEPRDFARLLDAVADRPDRDLIEAVLLRTQSLAVYLPENLGHFGLALSAYAHFTSPIRRYPDLLVHRAILHALEHRDGAGYPYTPLRMGDLADRCSTAERRAEEASRDVDERLKCAFMEAHIGDRFSGRVTGVTAFGLFVELDETRVSGLVHVTSLPNDYYHFDPIAHRLAGERGGRVFRLADPVTVTVQAVNADERKIDLAWTESP